MYVIPKTTLGVARGFETLIHLKLKDEGSRRSYEKKTSHEKLFSKTNQFVSVLRIKTFTSYNQYYFSWFRCAISTIPKIKIFTPLAQYSGSC